MFSSTSLNKVKFQVVSFPRVIVGIQSIKQRENLEETGVFGILGSSITNTFTIFVITVRSTAITMPPATTTTPNKPNIASSSGTTATTPVTKASIPISITFNTEILSIVITTLMTRGPHQMPRCPGWYTCPLAAVRVGCSEVTAAPFSWELPSAKASALPGNTWEVTALQAACTQELPGMCKCPGPLPHAGTTGSINHSYRNPISDFASREPNLRHTTATLAAA